MIPHRWIWRLLLLPACLPAQQYPFIPVAHSPRNIEHILEDRQGRLWVGTHDDVLCFDGERFFSMREFGLPALVTNSLVEDADGGILIATFGGLYRFFRGRVQPVVSGPAVDDVIGVAPGLLLATMRPDRRIPGEVALYRIRAVHNAWQIELLVGWKTGPYLTRDRSGSILAGCAGGWCEMSPRLIEDWSPGHPTVPMFHKSGSDMDRVLRDRYGCLWFRSSEAVAYQCPDTPRPVPLPANIAGRNIWAGERENEDGSMLFASVGALAVGRPGSFQVVTPVDGLPPESISCALRTRDGSIWIGALAGLYRFPYPFRLTYWKSRYGLVWSFARSGGAILAGTSAGVARLNDDGEWKALPGSREFGSFSALLPNPDGSIYGSVAREGVILLGPDGNLAARTPPDRGGVVQTLTRAADGTVLASGRGIYRLIRKGRDLLLTSETPPGATVPDGSLVVSDPRGGVWSCTAGGLLRREAGGWRTVAHDGLLRQPVCRSLAFDAAGDAWIAYGATFTLVHPDGKGGSIVRLYTAGGEIGTPAALAYAFGADPRGWLWRGASDGVYVADSAQARAGVWLRMNEIDGLSDLDVNHNSFFTDIDGSMWWAAGTGIMHFYPPPDLVHPKEPPPVFLSAFSVAGGPPRLAQTIDALPNSKKLTVHFGSLQFEGRNALRIRYRLLPEQKDWRESAALDLDLGTVGWGSHTLEFQSRFNSGSWSPSWSRQFTILRPWWLSLPAILAFAGIGFGGTAGAVRWRRKVRARAETTLPDLAGWRMAALSPESQFIGATLDKRFKLVGLVARGGFATVLRGRDLQQGGRPCAVKIFRRETIEERWLDHRFQQEVSALEQIHHPSVVSIYSHGVAPGGAPYLAMEFIEGGTLRDLLNSGPLNPSHAASLLRQAVVALEQIHAHGIYHRDLKPENLMLRAGAPSGEELVLIDFSIAIVKEPDQTMHGLSRAAGTIYYMAPEQAIGFATPASDVYSLAKIVLEMLTGQRLSVLLPHASMDLPERVREMARGMPIPLSAESVDLLGAALEFDPSRRPQTAPQFARPLVRDLTSASSDLSASSCP